MKKVIAGLAAASVVGVAVPGMDSAHAQVSNEALKEINGQTQTNVTETKTVETKSDLKYTVTADVLNVRSGAGTGHNVISKVKSGQVLQVIGQENGWFKVTVNGQTGYVSGDFVTTGGQKGTTTTVQQGTGTYTVNVSSLNVRTGPSTSHTVLGSVNKGKTVQVVGEVQDWFKINFNGGTGYVSKDFVTKGGSAVSNQTQQPTTNNNTTTVQTGGSYVVNTGALKVRTGPATYNAVIGGVTNGTVLNVTGAENGWYKINHNGRTGYVSADFVKFVKGGVNNVTNNVQQPVKDVQKPTTGGDTSSIAGFARSLNGSPYRTAGTTPAGFDCSGFIHYVLNQTGHKGARQTVAGYWSSKTKTSNPQPGDLVYFQNTYKSGPSHMGVYLGNGQFISAETDATGVRISSVSNSYWSKHMLGYTKAY
ncbi:enterotoxin EntFM [Bacillus fungorum]|uniref:Peptidase P60 n=1 Tax=Bacillus fungorum TaxID=2039284 RepID=A0A2G6Q637_9BACI|nr:enterotoxin EntFM [Bacillus fungorum]PIE92287.1 peptidase P60 [Bacillus fungorum]